MKPLMQMLSRVLAQSASLGVLVVGTWSCVAFAQPVPASATSHSVPSGVSTGAVASTGVDPADANLWQQRIEHQRRDAILRMAIATARLEKKLSDIRAGRDSDPGAAQSPGGVMRSGGFGTPMIVQPQSELSMSADPSERQAAVEDVFTSPKINHNQPSAVIRFPGGHHVTVTAGSKVPSLGTITNVSREQVLYRNAGGHELALPFSGEQ